MAAPSHAFTVCLDVVIRPCREEDLPALEWFGLFAPHRPLIRRTFEQQARGEAVMLVAEANGEPSGQLWVDLERRKLERVGVVWAVRVLPCLQGLGIGTRLLDAAEALLLDLGFAWCELSVETDNPAGRAYYQRLGYRLKNTTLAIDPPELSQPNPRLQWVLAKKLRSKACVAVGSAP
jgi:ribosomal protein S18 acetylase RimI-like enzyme